MVDKFKITCPKCKETTTSIQATVINEKIRIKFVCLLCGYVSEAIIVDRLKKLKSGDIWWNEFKIDGKKYRKIGRQEIIEEGAMHSWCGNKLSPIRNPETIGDIPANFSDKREFYNLFSKE